MIAEGIETANDLACLNGLGLGLGQGYHLGRPLAQPARALDEGVTAALAAFSPCHAAHPWP